jgi:cyclic pyranopterin monophosphate synthase
MAGEPTLTHLSPQGGVRMVDVSGKTVSMRTALAAGRVLIGEEAFRLVREHKIRKGDVLSVAQVAGIMAAKQTSKMIPLCHDVYVEGVDIELTLDEVDYAVEIRAYAKSFGPTGVEMEALMAVSIAALTVYDMVKSVTKDLAISDIRLLAKTGGASGDYRRTETTR